MGWQDDPVVAAQASQPAWANDPVVAPQQPQQKQPSFFDRAIQSAAVSSPVATGVVELLAHGASGSVATPAAGYAGLLSGNGDNVGKTQEALTYQPRTPIGQLLAKAGGLLPGLITKGADATGQVVSDTTGSPLLGTAANVGVQMLPALLLRGKAGKVAGEAAPEAAKIAEPAATPAVKAQEYVSRSTSLDWASLSDGIKTKLTEIAQKAGGLEKLDPKALERQARLDSLPVKTPATLGQLTRDPVQLRNEGNAAATEGGKPIRQIHVAQNKALIDNLEVLKGRIRSQPTKGAAETPEQTGLSVQDEALRAKLKLREADVSKKYKDAEAAGELEGKVSPKPIFDLLKSSPDKTHLQFVTSWLNDMKVRTKTETGTITNKLSLKELEDLRQSAVAKRMNGGTDGYYASKVISAIDEATEGAGGTAYKAARASRKAQALEFEDQGAVARLVENKSRTDRSTALEDTWRQTVIGGSIADLRNVKRSLLTGGNAKTRTAGNKAWNDVQAQTLDYIVSEATKSVTRFEDGTPNLTAAALEKPIKAIGQDKLREVFGSQAAAHINRVMEATRDLKTEPPASFKGSPTFANLIAFLEKGIRKIPVAGDVAIGAVKGAAKLREMGKADREVKTAQETPLGRANALATLDERNQLRRTRNLNALSRSRGYTVTSQDRN